MAPAYILLDRMVVFRSHPEDPKPFDTAVVRAKGMPGAERAKQLAGATTAAEVRTRELDTESSSIVSYLMAMTPDLGEVVEAPELSRLTMLRPLSSDKNKIPNHHGWSFLRDGAVATAAAAHKNLVVLIVGPYRPAYSRWHLLLDLDDAGASSSSAAMIPAITYDEYAQSYRTAGYGVVIMARGEGGAGAAFVLADLRIGIPSRGFSMMGMLCLWQPSLCKWVYKEGRLPVGVAPRTWKTHMSFPVNVQTKKNRNTNLFCWVNLLHGLLLCDLGPDCEVVDSLDFSSMVSFVPLPHGCYIGDGNPQWMNPQEYRSSTCVDGTIKFLTMDAFLKGGPISLVTYTLDLDDKSWMADTELRLEEDVWADKTFIANDVPRVEPLFPNLSTLEHDVVYLVIPGDLEREEGYRIKGVKFLLSVDTRQRRVISVTQQKQQVELVRWRHPLAFTVSHYHSHWGSKCHHQGMMEGTGMEASAKRMKFE